MRIGFDFDATLSTLRIQNVAKQFISDGHEVWVVTTRTSKPNLTLGWDNKRLFSIVDELGISRDRVVFTEGEDKHIFLSGFNMFFDDNELEIELIEENLPECAPIHVAYRKRRFK